MRSEGQTMIGCWCEEALVEKIDRARGSHTRSHFCREAIAEKLRALGFKVSDQEVAAPDRKGKGGPKRTVYRLSRYRAELNEGGSGGGSGKKPPKKGPGNPKK
jgi:hypothetical protein